ncbi:MAG: queuosine precursor transporter [Clostridiales bacterium]|jgi:uncharacterized integral membrane protein (TIGR00697 family)|nr:queuosine precursor transporter [Clostridiales bacterium]
MLRRLKLRADGEPKKSVSKSEFLNVITLVYIVLIIAANVMASKVVLLFGFLIDAGTLTYPFTFLIGDVLSEIFGYKQARKTILLGFGANLAFSFFALVGTFFAASETAVELSAAYDLLFSYNIRILAASFAGYIAGSLLNAASLIWIRKLTGKKYLALRTVGSTAIGALADTLIFTFAAWAFTVPLADMLAMAATSYVVKMIFETVIATPIDYLLIPVVKKVIKDESA